jgi:2',3'-cyclic-nucleotide 2'-phosphodiesterase (5'-nucleotidase family)
MLIGDLGLQLGPEVLCQRIAEAQFPLLSANVQLASSGELLAQPYTVLERGGREVGIIGLTSELAQLTLIADGDPYVLLKADEVLPKVVAELAQQTDIIVVLSNMGYDEDQRLSSLVPGIDLIVGGRSRLRLPEGWRNEQTGAVIVQAGDEGKCIGRCQLHLDSAGTVTSHSCALLDLTEDHPDDPEMRSFLNGYQVQ